MKFDQYEHKEIYGLPRTAKLKGFLVVNEEKEDMLALFMNSDEILRTAYTKDPNLVMLFQSIDKTQFDFSSRCWIGYSSYIL